MRPIRSPGVYGKIREMLSEQTCSHSSIRSDSSPHAAKVGYEQRSLKQRTSAARLPGSPAPSGSIDPTIFPAPLVLPGDDLALDPEYPPQSVLDWLDEEDRNEVTSDRKTVYVVAPPEYDEDAYFAQAWTSPRVVKSQHHLIAPNPQDIVGYLAAFYHGMPVKLLRVSDFRFLPWDGQKPTTSPRFIGLAVSDECIGIRTRACPDKLYPRQLNLDDLLDVAISILPQDAYALCLLVNHDLYEDADDTFVCGRAYGGSRVAVVSSARYCPTLDEVQSVDREHSWPASHCDDYVRKSSGSYVASTKKRRTASESSSLATAPLTAAVAALSSLPNVDVSPRLLSSLWLSRLCRTASHELGHCFGIDHCVYYACIMQGSASLLEDSRQPPYLCPVDCAKLVHATGSTPRESYLALLEYCNKQTNRETHFFTAFAAWLTTALRTVTR